MSDQQTPAQSEPPGLDLEALAREMPFPPTWDERDALLDDALWALGLPPDKVASPTSCVYALAMSARALGLPPDKVASPGRPSPLDARVGPDPMPRRPPRRPRP